MTRSAGASRPTACSRPRWPRRLSGAAAVAVVLGLVGNLIVGGIVGLVVGSAVGLVPGPLGQPGLAATPPATPGPTDPSGSVGDGGSSVPTDGVVVTLTELTPLDPAAAPTVTFAGTITNLGPGDLSVLNAYLRLSRVPVTDPGDLARITDPTFRPGARQPVFELAASELPAGQTASFRVEVSAEQLGLVEAGVYAAGVEVLATHEDGSREAVGRAMTALPWMPVEETVEPVGVAMAWPVTAAVDRATDGSYLSEHLGEAMAPGGTLGAVLAVPVDAPVSWLVDPAVLEAAADLADGYRVRAEPDVPGDPAGTVVGRFAGRAASWLDRIRALGRSGRVTLLPYANVDLVALERAGRGDDVTTALALADDVAAAAGVEAADPTWLLRPPGGVVNEPTAERLLAAGLDRLLLDQPAVRRPGTGHLAAIELGPRTLTAVLADASVRAALEPPSDVEPPEPHDPDDPDNPGAVGAPANRAGVHARQLLLARTALGALTGPGMAPGGALVVTGDGVTGSPSEVLTALTPDVPWLTVVDLRDVLPDRQSPALADGELDYPERAAAAELPGAHVDAVTRWSDRWQLLDTLTGGQLGSADAGGTGASLAPTGSDPSTSDPGPSPEPPDAGPADDPVDDPVGSAAGGADAGTSARLRLLSAAWRAEPDRAAQLLADALASVDAELSKVHVADGGSITLSSRTGRFPLTVVNDLLAPVTVQLTLASRTPARLRLPEVTTVDVPAGAQTTVDVAAEANANGEYAVEVQLATADGTRFGPVSTLTVRATDYDTVAWIIMGTAGALLLLGSARRISQRVRAARRPPPGRTGDGGSASDPVGGGQS